MMLDRLESGDGAAELLAHLGVVDGGLDAVGRPAHRLGGQQRPRPGQCRFPRPGRISSSLTLTLSSRTRPERRVGSRFSGTSTDTPARSRSTTSTSSPAAISRRSASPAPSTTPASPSATPSLIRTSLSRPIPAVTVPSISPGSNRDFCSAEPSLAITADAMTVGTKGPGATARPSSSITTTSSGSPKPEPPYSSSTCRPSQPSSTRPCQNGGTPLVGRVQQRARRPARLLRRSGRNGQPRRVRDGRRSVRYP